MNQTYCCQLASAIEQDRLLCKTSNFFVIPTLGSMGIEGYILVIPKIHYPSISQIPDPHQSELNELLSNIKRLIKLEYNLSTLIFEHGPRIGNLDSGQSVDHAHLHIIPGADITKNWAVDLMMRLGHKGQFYRVDRVEGLDKARDLILSGSSYLYMQTPEGVELVSEQNFPRPPQYFRTMVANKIKTEKWDWRQFPDYKTLEKTVERLHGKL
ncbi:MAG: HIT family protein [Candidatus Nanoarchaeia archaeon]|nr:HIT family protein [Candidatus Nanoarchaeia archaeon]